MSKPTIPKNVLDAINGVRESGAINMLDRVGVTNILIDLGEGDCAHWIRTHKKEYATLIFRGPNAFEVID